MTAIELLVASTLAAMLMVAVLGILTSLASQRRALRDRPPTQMWRVQLVEQLRWDLANARQMSWRRDGLRLVGFGGRDAGSGVTTHRPVEVVYDVQSLDGQSWLIRRERRLDGRSNRDTYSELACAGVTGMELRSWEDELLPQREGPVPDVIRLLLTSNEDEPLLDRVLLIR